MITVLEDAPTRADLEEAMTHVVATIRRTPAHWADKRAALHETLDGLLDDWQTVPS